jgi:hypothetical protein
LCACFGGCPQPCPQGACCHGPTSCEAATAVDCLESGGSYKGDGTGGLCLEKPSDPNYPCP